MNKAEFLDALRMRLGGLPDGEVDDRLIFYGEMIDDRIEEGLSEEDAVSAMGSVEEVASQILSEIPLGKIVKGRIKPKRRMSAWEIVLLILGSPIWLSLALSALAVILSLYISLWAVVVSLWATFASLAGSAFGAIVLGTGYAILQDGCAGLALIGAGLVLAGVAILFFLLCRAATKGAVWLAPKIVLGIKRCFVKKEGVR